MSDFEQDPQPREGHLAELASRTARMMARATSCDRQARPDRTTIDILDALEDLALAVQQLAARVRKLEGGPAWP